MRPLDTTPEAWEEYLRIIGAKSPEERLQMAMRHVALVRALQEAGLRQRFPDADEEEIRVRADRQKTQEELLREACSELSAIAAEAQALSAQGDSVLGEPLPNSARGDLSE